MSASLRLRLFSYAVYAVLITGIAFESYSLVKQSGVFGKQQALSTYRINIEGNIRKPGWYAVPEGTTHFEILKVAGVRPTSDLSVINLASQIGNNQSIRVGTLDKPVIVTDRQEHAKVEFFFGDAQITHTDGKTSSLQSGNNVLPGERIQVRGVSQAEISISSFSRIDLDNFADVTFEKINQTYDNHSVTELTQSNGSCWHRIVYANADEIYRVFTRSVVLTIVGSGADFLLDIQNDQIVINVMNGLLLVERRAGGESTNMISGQSATIYDDDRPFQITRLAPDISANEQFSQLTESKSDALVKDAPLNMFFSIAPSIFYLVRTNFQKGEIHLIRVPESLLIEQFTQNMSTIDQAYLYGGSQFVVTFLERLFDTRIQKYMSTSKDGIERIIDIFGGITVDVDTKAASYLSIAKGRQKLTSKYITRYLSPSISGVADANGRQSQALRALYDEFRSKNFIPTIMSADQIMSASESSINAQEMIEYFSKFAKRSDWVYKEYTIPSRVVNRNARQCFDPLIEDCRRIMSNE
ncbi:MAG: LCP family protein [Fibrobacterota bacterium]|nr:LCP family protein [Chitinispirillaceae bacterium]